MPIQPAKNTTPADRSMALEARYRLRQSDILGVAICTAGGLNVLIYCASELMLEAVIYMV
jgi:hypothetical protein